MSVDSLAMALRNVAIWDIIFEHCSYFGPRSLHRAFVDGGFDVLDLRSYYGDTFIGIEAKPQIPGRTTMPPSAPTIWVT